MEVAKTLEDLIIMVGLNEQDEPTSYAVCMAAHLWRTAPVLWGKPGTERIEVYELSLTAKPLKTIVMGDTEEGE
jgi:hypothetical protein